MKMLDRLKPLFFLLALLVLTPGCVPIEEIAPPVPALTGATAPSAQLEQGRQIYIGKCATCHAPEPITNYTRQDWPGILWDMSDRTNLSPAESAAVEAYVFAVLDSAGM